MLGELSPPTHVCFGDSHSCLIRPRASPINGSVPFARFQIDGDAWWNFRRGVLLAGLHLSSDCASPPRFFCYAPRNMKELDQKSSRRSNFYGSGWEWIGNTVTGAAIKSFMPVHFKAPPFRPPPYRRAVPPPSPHYQVWLTAVLLPPLFCHSSGCAASAGWLHSTTAGGDNNLHWSDPSARPAVANGDRLSCGGAINCPTPGCVCVCEEEDTLVFVL